MNPVAFPPCERQVFDLVLQYIKPNNLGKLAQLSQEFFKNVNVQASRRRCMCELLSLEYFREKVEAMMFEMKLIRFYHLWPGIKNGTKQHVGLYIQLKLKESLSALSSEIHSSEEIENENLVELIELIKNPITRRINLIDNIFKTENIRQFIDSTREDLAMF